MSVEKNFFLSPRGQWHQTLCQRMTGNSKQSVCQEHQPGAETWIHSALELILQKLEGSIFRNL
jgi:hypothetical protein